MRGVAIFIGALFVLAPWYLLGVTMIEPLSQIAKDFAISQLGGKSRVDFFLDVYFYWAPMAYVVAWFVWTVRYYLSPERFVGGGVR